MNSLSFKLHILMFLIFSGDSLLFLCDLKQFIKLLYTRLTISTSPSNTSPVSVPKSQPFFIFFVSYLVTLVSHSIFSPFIILLFLIRLVNFYLQSLFRGSQWSNNRPISNAVDFSNKTNPFNGIFTVLIILSTMSSETCSAFSCA